MFLHIGLTELHIFFMTRSTTFFSSTIFIISRLLFFLKEGNPLKVYFQGAKKEACDYAENALYYRCFSRNLAKIYRTANLPNFFRCMQGKSQWGTYPVVFLDPLMLVVTKGHTYLNKLEALVEGSLKYVWPFVTTRR